MSELWNGYEKNIVKESRTKSNKVGKSDKLYVSNDDIFIDLILQLSEVRHKTPDFFCSGERKNNEIDQSVDKETESGTGSEDLQTESEEH